MTRGLTVEQRIAEKVDWSGGPESCWLWTAKSRGQWGTVALQVGGKRGRMLSLQRIVYAIAYGPLRADVRISMSCGLKHCINPFHFVLKPPVTMAQRFWSYVKRGPGCWEWTGHRARRGYGEFTLNRTTGTPAHRFSYELHNGPVPAGHFVCHHCDNPPCVRPDHLFAGTNQDNVDDMWRKGRGSRGEKHAITVRAARARSLPSESKAEP